MYFVCCKFRVDKGKAGRRPLEISGVAILQNAVAILQKQENRPYIMVYGRFYSFKTFYEFRRSYSCNLMEISPRSGALSISDIVEQLMNVGISIIF